MSDAKEAKKEEGHADAAKPAGASKMLPLLVGLNSLLLVAVLGFLAFQMTHKPAPSGEAAAEEHADEAKPEEGKKEEHKEAKKEEKPKKEEKKKEEGHGEKKEGAAASSGEGAGPMVKIADFVVHLRNPETDRYARMSFDIEVLGDSDKEALNSNIPKVRDAFITYLSDRSLEDLSGSEGLSRTKDALQTRLRELVPETRVRALYISDFVVQ